MLKQLSLFGRELLIRFTVRVIRERLSICAYASFLFGFKGGTWDLTVLVPFLFVMFL